MARRRSEVLGHSTVGIALDLYSHVTPTMERAAAQAMDDVLVGESADSSRSASTLTCVAVNPDPDPIDLEIERALADNPGLLDELREFDRRFEAGEISDDEFVSTEEVRRRLGLAPLVMDRDGDDEREGRSTLS